MPLVFYLLLNLIDSFFNSGGWCHDQLFSSRMLSWLLAVREEEGVELIFKSLSGPMLLCYNKILVDEESYVKDKCCRVFLWFFPSRLSRFSWIFLSVIWRCFSAAIYGSLCCYDEQRWSTKFQNSDCVLFWIFNQFQEIGTAL